MTESRSSFSVMRVAFFLIVATLWASSPAELYSALNSADDVDGFSTAQGDEDARASFEKSLKRYPWYSSSNGSARFLPQRPQRETQQVKEKPQREYRPVEPKKPDDGGVFWWLVSTFILVILALVGWFCYRSLQMRSTRRKFQIEEELRRRRRVETLTEEAKDYYDDLKSATLAAREQGDFRRATIFLFSWILVELDKREFILLDKGKTNLEYFRELNDHESEQAIYRVAMTEFERVYFGGQPITRDEFDSRLYLLLDSFESIMSRHDELKRLQAVASVSAQNSSDGGGIRISQFCILALISVCLSSLGCNKEYWNDAYATPARVDYSRSLNSLSTFAGYCDSKLSNGLRSTSSCRLDDQSVDTIIWLGPANEASFYPGVFVLVKPKESNRESEMDRDDAFEANLKRYAHCDPEKDWKELYVPASNRRLYGSGYFSPRFILYDSESSSIEHWLMEKPNRVFVCVFDEWNASVEYWESALKDVQFNAPPDKRSAYLQECKRQIVDARNNRAAARTATLLAKEQLKERRAAAIRILNERNKDGDEEPDDFFDDDSRRQDEKERRDNYFTPMDDGVDFGDDWSESSDSGIDRPKKENVWCRSLFIDDAVERDDYSGSVFTGEPDWIAGLPPSTLREWTTLSPAEGTETLVALGGVPLICRRRVGESQIFFINSTSILSNYALTDSTNQKLVERLVREFNPDGRAQLALSELSHRNEMDIPPYSPGPFSLTKASPFTFMAWHAAALAFLVLFAAWPIWGRAKRLASERNNNFGRHVSAIAKILKEVNAVDWTREQIEAWRSSQQDRRDYGGNEDHKNG